jgi:hypothetical protein
VVLDRRTKIRINAGGGRRRAVAFVELFHTAPCRVMTAYSHARRSLDPLTRWPAAGAVVTSISRTIIRLSEIEYTDARVRHYFIEYGGAYISESVNQ